MSEGGGRRVQRIGPQEAAGAAIAAVLFVVLMAQIVLRAVGAPLVWVEEFSTIAFVCLVFTGAAAAFRRDEQLDVDLFQRFALRRLPASADRVWTVAVLLLQVLFLAVLAAGLILMARQAWSLHAGTLPGFRYGWLYLAVLAAVLASLAPLAGRIAAALAAPSPTGEEL